MATLMVTTSYEEAVLAWTAFLCLLQDVVDM